MDIYPIFNVANLYKFHVSEAEGTTQDGEDSEIKQHVQWKKQMPTTKPLHPERILDKRVKKKTRGKEYLVKWKDHPVEDSTWMTTTLLHKSRNIVEYLLDKSP